MKTSESRVPADAVELSCRIVSAYVAGNALAARKLPELIAEVHATLTGRRVAILEHRTVAPPTIAAIQASLGPGGLLSFETGRRYTSLRRHLGRLGLSSDAYRRKWGLSDDYPMVCPAHSARRSAIAKGIGLGHRTPQHNARLANV